jgi:hypothetical protein
MKGPYERLKYDLRRLWECPKCRRRERTEGTVTFRFCACQSQAGALGVPMKLVEEGGHRTVPPIGPLATCLPTDEPPAEDNLASPILPAAPPSAIATDENGQTS